MPDYISLEEAKKHLNIEPEFADDDDYIESLVDAAEVVVAEDICAPLCEMEDERGKIPSPLRQAILLMVGTFYAGRETIAYGVLVNETPIYRRLISLYRNYSR